MTTRLVPVRSTILLLFINLLMFGLFAPVCAANYVIQASAHPSRIVYGTDNNSAITVIVHDNYGNPAPDGTPVNFYTNLGTLPDIRYTVGGQVNVLLQNDTGPGEAMINITVGSSRQTLLVEYLGQGGVVVTKLIRISYHLTAKQVYYGVDQKVFDLRENAQLLGQDFAVKADAIQYDLNKAQVNAQGKVTITAGKKTLTAEKLVLLLNTHRGFTASVTPELAFQSFSLPKLEVHDDDDAARATDYQPLSPEPTHTWILCQQATVFPNDQIQFRWPKFYLNNFDHLLMVPPQPCDGPKANNTGTFFNSQIGLSSDGGLDVDFPIYYDASANHVGALHLRRVTEDSPDYTGTEGLSVGIQQEYLLSGQGDGVLYLDNLNDSTRSVTWQQTQTIANTHLNLNAGYECFSPDTPYTTRLGLTASRDFGKTNFTLSSNWSSFQGNQNGMEELTANLPAINLGKTKFSLAFSPYAGASQTVTTAANAASSSTDDATDPQKSSSPLPPNSPLADETTITTDLYFEGLRSALNFPTYKLLGGSLTPNTTDDVSRDNTGLITNNLDSGVSFQKKLNKCFT